MTTIKVYPSNLPGEPIECHNVDQDITLGEWLSSNCPSYRPGPDQPIMAIVSRGTDDIVVSRGTIDPLDWDSFRLAGKTIELRPVPQDLVTGLIIGALILGAVATAVFLKPKIPSMSTAQGVQGQQLTSADINANQPRLNGIIPEIAGKYKVYPDYLSQPRKYFNVDHKSQSVDVLLCIGQGEYAIDDDEIYIENTPLNSLTDISVYAINAPGASITDTPYAQIWYNSREVGNSTGSTGLRLTAGTAGTHKADASKYRIEGNSISVPQGSGVLPQDWDIGNIIQIKLDITTIEVVNDAAQYPTPQFDKVRGSFSLLGFAVNDIILMGPVNEGVYKIATLETPVDDPGTASTIVGSAATSLSFAATPCSFELNGFVIILDQDYSAVDYLIDDIESQTAGIAITESSGILTITELTPFSGNNISLSGYYAPVFGSNPTLAKGAKTQSYDEMTLWVWSYYYDENGEPQWSWFNARELTTGTFYNQHLQKARIIYNDEPPFFTPITEYIPTEFRIVDLIEGEIPGGATGTVGFEFQRLNPDGTDDLGWSNFGVDLTTEGAHVSMTLNSESVVGGWLGPFRATPANELSSIIEYDVLCPSGLAYIDDEGNINWHEVWFEVQWRENGGDWSASIYHGIAGDTKDQLGWTLPLNLPAAYSKVDIRMRRIGAENTSLNFLEKVEWYGLRCRLADVNSYAGVTTMTLTLQGSDKISTNSENKINLIVTRKLNGVATRSIAEWAKYVCSTVGYSSSDLNQTEFNTLGAIWNARGDYYDMGIVSPTTVKNELSRTLNAGFAEFTIDHGQIRPVRDQARTTFEQMYTPQNMLEPLKRQFQAYDPDEYNGVDVEYIDGVTWEKETVECRLSGDAGTRVEKIRLDGVTDRTRAWRIGMRERRMQKYRRKTYQFKTELDALNSKYLSYCLLADDVPGYDQSALLVDYSVAGGVATLTISEPRSGNLIALRRPDGSLAGPYAATAVSDHVFTIPTPDFSPIIPGTSQEPTHVLIGQSTNYHYDVLITEINPQGNSVSVQAVNYDARVYADDDNSPA